MFVVRFNVCRAPDKKRTACAKKTHSRLFIFRALFLACAVENAHGKAPLNRAPEGMRTTIIDFSVVNYQYL
jgi:hypothetical protein